MPFTIPAEHVDGLPLRWTPPRLPTGDHTLNVYWQRAAGYRLHCDNSVLRTGNETIDVNVQMSTTSVGSAVASVSTGSDVSTVTVCKARSIDGITVKEGAGTALRLRQKKRIPAQRFPPVIIPIRFLKFQLRTKALTP
jgi:hypothetical protein